MPDRSSGKRRAGPSRAVPGGDHRGRLRDDDGVLSRRRARRNRPRTTTAPSSSTRTPCAPTPTTTTRSCRSTARRCALRPSTPRARAGSPQRALRGRAGRDQLGERAQLTDMQVEAGLRDARRSCAPRTRSRGGKTEPSCSSSARAPPHRPASSCRKGRSSPSRWCSAPRRAAPCSARSRSSPA